MNKEDKTLIDDFVLRISKLGGVKTIILFGSLARGDEDKNSDIDIMIVVEKKKKLEYLDKVSEIITQLRPHRKIQPTITDLTDYDASFYQNVMKEGTVLFGKFVLDNKKLELNPYSIISYDLSGLKQNIKTKISQRVYGKNSRKKIKGKVYDYAYKGLKDEEGVYLISDSTLLLPEKKVGGFIQFLETYNIKYKIINLWKQY